MSNAIPIVVSYGMGTNSTAMLCGFRERGIVPDLIVAADTGAELPSAFENLRIMSEKVREWWNMEIHVVRAKRHGQEYGIVEHSLLTCMLPSLAYGMRSCSQKFKHQPMEKLVIRWSFDNKHERIIRAIGYGADEAHRILGKPIEKKLCRYASERYWYPLVDWNWRRADCENAICRNRIPKPGKSSCFFCPAMKPSEVINLSKTNPELMKTALDVEAKAQLRHRKKIGLGGEGNLWSDWIAQDGSQMKLLDIEPMHKPCNCLD